MRRTATGLGIALAVVGLSLGLSACGGSVSAADASKMALASSIQSELAANALRRTGVPTAPVAAAFLATADAICAPVLDYNASHPNPYPSFDFNHPDVATMKLEGAFFSVSPYTAALAQLIALPTPPSNAGSWTAFTTTAAALRDQVSKQNAAAIAGDTTTFTATLQPVNSLASALLIDAHQAGFVDTGPCARLFSSG